MSDLAAVWAALQEHGVSSESLADDARGLGHPIRIEALRLLTAAPAPRADRPNLSPSEIAEALGYPLGVVAYHVRRLALHRFVELTAEVPRRGAVEHFYRASARGRAVLRALERA